MQDEMQDMVEKAITEYEVVKVSADMMVKQVEDFSFNIVRGLSAFSKLNLAIYVEKGKSLEIEDNLEKIVLAQQTQGQTSTSVVVYDEADDAAPVDDSGGTDKLKTEGGSAVPIPVTVDVVLQVKQPKVVSFKPLPIALKEMEPVFTDFAKFMSPQLLHVCYQTIHSWNSTHSKP